MRVPQKDGSHRGGLIFNVSSLAGFIGLPGHAYYHAGKFAVEGFSESVAREMHPDWNSKSHNSSHHLLTILTIARKREELIVYLNSQHLYPRTIRCTHKL